MEELVVVLFILGTALPLELAPVKLPYSLYPSKEYVTVSGEGIGGIMAQIVHITHSEYISGIAVYDGTFYRCGEPDGSTENYLRVCASLTVNGNVRAEVQGALQSQIDAVVIELETYESNQQIDDLRNLRDAYIYAYCGMRNHLFSTEQQLLVISLYARYVASRYNFKTRVEDTKDPLQVIDTSYSSYNKPTCSHEENADGTVDRGCSDFSAPADALGFLLGKSSYFVNPFYGHNKYIHLEPLRSFDQLEFTVDLNSHGLDDVGYFYVPKYCQYRNKAHKYGHHEYGYGYYKEPCKLHIYFHDCDQGREFKGTSHIIKSNYLEIAEANKIIMLFPQALSSANNPVGCWDFVGWSGPLFATNKGSQVIAIWRMIGRLLYLPTKVVEDTSARMAKMKAKAKPQMIQNDGTKCVGPACRGNAFYRS